MWGYCLLVCIFVYSKFSIAYFSVINQKGKQRVILFLSIHLLERQKNRQRSFGLWFSAQLPTSAGPMPKQGVRNSIQVSYMHPWSQILDPSLLPPRVNISRKLELGVEARNKIQGLGCEIWDNSYSEREHQQQLYCLWPRIMVLKCKNSKNICYQCDKDPRLSQLSKIHIIGKYNSIEVSSLFRI